MPGSSSIEWTDVTWNPVVGCDKISLGCNYCYAEAMTRRFPDRFPNGFNLTLHPERLEDPLNWRKPRRVFVNSMSDLHHKGIPPDFVASVYDVMEQADWHMFQVLTKRSSLLRDFTIERYGDGACPAHIWLGCTVEDRSAALARIGHLQEARASVRFLSVEPLLGPIGEVDLTGIDWLIVGGESGCSARRMDPKWAREIVVQAKEQGTAVFVKQLGSVLARELGIGKKGGALEKWPKEFLDLAIREYPNQEK